MNLKILWSVRYVYVTIFLHCASSLPLENNAPMIPEPASENLLKDVFPLVNSEMHFNELNYTNQIYVMNSNGAKKISENHSTSLTLPSNYIELSRDDRFITAYKLHSTKVTWNQARSTCQQEGGYLAYLDSAEEGRKFQDDMTRNNTAGVWMGMHDLFEEGDWVTVLGEKVSQLGYVNWRRNEPNNAGTNGEHCGALGLDAMMNDVPCNDLRAYFCKIRLKYINVVLLNALQILV